MDDLFMIHLDDYLSHIDDKLTLYAMLRQMEAVIGKLPECKATNQARKQMAAFSPRMNEMWEGWNIPMRYLVSCELDDLSEVMEDELMEPEDAGYYSEGSDIYAADNCGNGMPDHTLLLALMDTADKLYDDYAALVELARKQLRRCEQ